MKVLVYRGQDAHAPLVAYLAVLLVLPLFFLLSILGLNAAEAQCPTYQAGQALGTLQAPALTELSGLVASRTYPGVYWAHNDSGDIPRIFALTETGQNLGIYNLTDASAVDWEDIALGPGPIPGQDYLYLADTGDNALVRADIRIYRIPEPFATTTQPSTTVVNISGADELIMTYPLGLKFDCETLLSDPATGDLFLVTKELSNTQVFRNPAPHAPSVSTILEQVGNLQGNSYATGGDISYDGALILIRGYFVANVRLRTPGTSVADALSVLGCSVPLASESQGEAIAFTADACSYLTIGEGLNAPANFYLGDAPCNPIFPDQDNDGLSDAVEASLCTRGDVWDTDGDGLSDYVEVTNNGTMDVADYMPGVTHTDACNPDTDNDGVTDLQEFNFGTDPLDINDFPALPVKSVHFLLFILLVICIYCSKYMKRSFHN